MSWTPLQYQPGHATLGQKVDDISTWSLQEKVLFLNSYGWIAAAGAKNIQVGEGFFTGILSIASDLTKSYIQAAIPVFNFLPRDTQSSVEKMEENLGPVVSATEKSRNESRKRLSLRDAVVKDLVNRGSIVEYERWGDDPRFPGELVKATLLPIGRESGRPDFSFIFSTMSPQNFVQAGMSLQNTAKELGYKPDRPFSLDGPQLGVPIIGVILVAMAVIAATLFALWGLTAESSKSGRYDELSKHVDAAVKSKKITAAEGARILLNFENQSDYFRNLFEKLEVGLAVLIAVAVAAIGIPLIVSLTSK